MESRDVQRLYSKSLEDLYEELGRSIVAPELGKRAPARELAVQRGKSFVSDHLEKLRAKICGEWRYCSRRSEYANFQSLASALAPLVSSVAGVPASAAMIVTILLMRIGLDDLCHCPNA